MNPKTPTRPYRVRNSAIHGRGVFAATTIRKGALWWISYRERDSGGETSLRVAMSPDLL